MFKLCITGDLGFEFWKDVKGFEGLYKVSTYGRVKSLLKAHNKGVEKILKLSNSHGYLKVALGHDNHRLVHRIVAEAFLPKWKNSYDQVNHKTEVKTENQVWNLEYCDSKYNNNYGTASKRTAEKNRNGKLSKKINQYTLNGVFVREWPSMNEITRVLGFATSNICNAIKGKEQKTSKGFIWRYAETEK